MLSVARNFIQVKLFRNRPIRFYYLNVTQTISIKYAKFCAGPARSLRCAAFVCVRERAKPFKLMATFVEMECLPWAGCGQDTRNERAVKIESVMQFRSR